jgi:hypothetical protein
VKVLSTAADRICRSRIWNLESGIWNLESGIQDPRSSRIQFGGYKFKKGTQETSPKEGNTSWFIEN